jgi:hypothetical protein
MSMSIRDFKTVGTVGGLLLFAVPLVALYLHLRSWGSTIDPKDIKLYGSRHRRVPDPDAHRRPPARPPAPPPRRRPRPAFRAVSGPVAFEAKRKTATTAEFTLSNVSAKKIRVVIPGRLGGVVRVVGRARKQSERTGPVYDDEVDVVVPLLPGGSQTWPLKSATALPRSRLKAVYDTRGEGLPEGAWSGRIEVDVARGP